MSDRLKPETAERVLERLGLRTLPRRDLDGLNAIYGAWCRAVPFDNVRKLIALRAGDPAPLPGGYAEDFHQNLLAHGTGGTCWPSSNGLFALIDFCGFDARRVSAGMQDSTMRNHGSVLVRLEGEDWLADSSMLTDRVLRIRRGETHEVEHPLHPVRVEPVDGTLRIHWALTVADGTLPCRLLDDPVDHAFYLERYEVTRASGTSPFNHALYARRNSDAAVLSYAGRTRFWKRPDGVASTELEPDDLAASLVEELGLSEEIVERLRALEGL